MGLTRDAFLGGRLQLWQPREGYRAGIDPVLLAAAVPARAGQRVLDLGCGVGTALLCLGARVPGLDLTGVEILADYADLARRNAAENGIAARIVTADVSVLPADLKAEFFDHVLTNPPYFVPNSRTPSAEPGRESGRGEALPLGDWIDAALRRLRPGGRITLIQRADRLAAILTALGTRAGAILILPITARSGRPARHVIVTALKGRADTLRLLQPLVLHEGDSHAADAENYRSPVQDVLRYAEPLPDLVDYFRLHVTDR